LQRDHPKSARGDRTDADLASGTQEVGSSHGRWDFTLVSLPRYPSGVYSQLMLRVRRTLVLAVATAMVIAGSFAPRLAHAHSALHAKVERIDRSHSHGHDHHGTGHVHCPEKGEAKDQGGKAGSQNSCCAAACASTVFILSSQLLPDVVHGHRQATVLAEQWRSFVPSALDPPPRTN
jgi:hypothetical protein